ncbi:hypothetical protein OBBRIDRAFT_788919 [Obba rivulosa]|uniref:Uncharacterized protein n=1 Tax=Obba rivulosa TaxID=1052685 RepID=A0A8E2DSE4_9APHY|nr:hypothetical protein OBBRIDRAFT_788919 [Obba rivulosa]
MAPNACIAQTTTSLAAADLARRRVPSTRCRRPSRMHLRGQRASPRWSLYAQSAPRGTLLHAARWGPPVASRLSAFAHGVHRTSRRRCTALTCSDRPRARPRRACPLRRTAVKLEPASASGPAHPRPNVRRRCRLPNGAKHVHIQMTTSLAAGHLARTAEHHRRAAAGHLACTINTATWAPRGCSRALSRGATAHTRRQSPVVAVCTARPPHRYAPDNGRAMRRPCAAPSSPPAAAPFVPPRNDHVITALAHVPSAQPSGLHIPAIRLRISEITASFTPRRTSPASSLGSSGSIPSRLCATQMESHYQPSHQVFRA